MEMEAARSILLILIVVVLIVYIAGFVIPRGPPETNTSSVLSTVEIRDYQGQKLDSVTDFRENSIKGPQHINITTYQLAVGGLVDRPLNLTYGEVLAYPHYEKVVTLHCVEGWDATVLWDGVRVIDLLNEAGVRPGANTVIFYAYDGYSTSLPLDFVKNNNILLASGMNNVTLPVDRGFPFQLVAEDKWGYKWIKWVTKIELSDDPGYRGYWEQRGYSLNGNLSESFFS
ncbi:MAG TPA: molybdopterin-dependent oxidoreductase [Methanoregulaceae archaeon]|nr:molybdopterin-dependent oxidoreductase [Methanoregulaceae archaeon]